MKPCSMNGEKDIDPYYDCLNHCLHYGDNEFGCHLQIIISRKEYRTVTCSNRTSISIP